MTPGKPSPEPSQPAERDPFAVLGIAPTLDPAVVKRGYFAALTRHPPHVDPEGFRRIREAYEVLRGDGLRAAHLAAAPVSPDGRDSARIRLRAARAEAVARAATRSVERERIAAFEAILASPWDDVVAMFRDPA